MRGCWRIGGKQVGRAGLEDERCENRVISLMGKRIGVLGKEREIKVWVLVTEKIISLY